MIENYLTHTSIDFATDKFFLEWRILQTEESCAFWSRFVETHPDKQEVIQEAIRILQSVAINRKEFSFQEKQRALKCIRNRVRQENKRKARLLYPLLLAATVLVLLYIFDFLSTPLPDKASKDLVATMSEKTSSGNAEIQLILNDEVVLDIEADARIQYDSDGRVSVDSMLQKTVTDKVSDKKQIGKKDLNKLVVPKGRRTSLVLSDGSEIWVNSGSVVKFPSIFEGSTREIYVNGEIYIQVSKNKDCPFIVHTPSSLIKVLGTSFNVSAYAEDTREYIVLETGSIAVHLNNNETVRMQTPELLTIRGPGSYSVSEVDVYDYISWKDGIFRFSSERLGNVMLRLSRYYDLDIECGKEEADIRFTGKLVLFDDWQTVLDNITVISPVSYEIIDHRIYINYKK